MRLKTGRQSIDHVAGCNVIEDGGMLCGTHTQMQGSRRPSESTEPLSVIFWIKLRTGWNERQLPKNQSPLNKGWQFVSPGLAGEIISYTISQMTGLGTSTICTIVSEVSQAIVDCLWDQEVGSLMPKSEADLCKKMHEMEETWQFPCCWSAVDGCHIPIKCPAGGLESSKEYQNFKNFYSVILMAMVDYKYRFIWGSCGFPGNTHDSIIFQSTDIWTSIMENEAILKTGKEVEGVHIPALIFADAAFQGKMKPYGNAVLTAKQRYFNYRLSRARMVTEGAYGQLKGCWRILHRKCESSAKEVKIITLACVILHNICLSQNDQLPRYWDITTDLKTNGEIREMLDMTKAKKVKDSEKETIKIRNALADRFWKEKVEAKKCNKIFSNNHNINRTVENSLSVLQLQLKSIKLSNL